MIIAGAYPRSVKGVRGEGGRTAGGLVLKNYFSDLLKRHFRLIKKYYKSFKKGLKQLILSLLLRLELK